MRKAVTPKSPSRESGKLLIPGREDFKALGQRIKTRWEKIKGTFFGEKKPPTAATPIDIPQVPIRRLGQDETIKVGSQEFRGGQAVEIPIIRDGKVHAVAKGTIEGVTEDGESLVVLGEDSRYIIDLKSLSAERPPLRQSTLEDLERVKAQAKRLDVEEEGSQVMVYAHPDGRRVIKEYRPTAHTSHQQTQKVRQKLEDLGYGDLLAYIDEEFVDPTTGRVLAYTQERVTPLSRYLSEGKGEKPDLSRIEEAAATLRKEGLDIEIKPQNLGIRKNGTVALIDTDDTGVMTRRLIRDQTKRNPFSPQTKLQETRRLKPGDTIKFTYQTKGGIKEGILGKILSFDEVPMGPQARASAEELDLVFIQFEDGTISRMDRSYADALTRQPYVKVVPETPLARVAPVRTPSPPPAPAAPPPRRSTDVLLSDPCVKRLGAEPCLQLDEYFSALPEEDVVSHQALDTLSTWVTRGGELTPAEKYLLVKTRELHPGDGEIERIFSAIGVQDPSEALKSQRSLTNLKKEWQSLRKSIEAMSEESAQSRALLLEDLDEIYADHIRNIGLGNLSKSDSIVVLKQRWQDLGKYVSSVPNPAARQRLMNTINIVYVNGVQYHAKKILGEGSNAYTAFNRLVPALTPERGVASISHAHLNLGTALLENTYAIGGRELSHGEVFELLHRLHRTDLTGYDIVVEEMVRTLQKEGAESLNGHLYQAHVGTKFARLKDRITGKPIVTQITYEPLVPAAHGGTLGRADMIFQYWTGRNSLIETKANLNFPEASDQGRKLKAQLERYARVLKEDIPIDGVPIHFVEIHSPREVLEGGWIDQLVDRLNSTLPKGKQIKFEVTP
ncbi:MAG: hypothetical protein HYY61_00875 [Deltaproteobacteria bacterium]|nr:hypothetical protein [Deltaproteobacteria bacterium]